jgi:hypothetical protein
MVECAGSAFSGSLEQTVGFVFVFAKSLTSRRREHVFTFHLFRIDIL